MMTSKDCAYAVLVKDKNEEVYEIVFYSRTWEYAARFNRDHIDHNNQDSIIIELVNGRPIVAY